MSEVRTHEAVCAERYKATMAAIGELRGWLKWVGVTAVSAILALGIWGFQQWVTVAQAKAQTQEAQFANLNRRLNDLAASARPSAVVIAPNGTQGAMTRSPKPTVDPYTGSVDAAPETP